MMLRRINVQSAYLAVKPGVRVCFTREKPVRKIRPACFARFRNNTVRECSRKTPRVLPVYIRGLFGFRSVWFGLARSARRHRLYLKTGLVTMEEKHQQEAET